MMNTDTGEARMLSSDDMHRLMESHHHPNDVVGPDEVLVRGTEEQIRRLSAGIKALDADEKRKAKRKSQRAARKQNR